MNKETDSCRFLPWFAKKYPYKYQIEPKKPNTLTLRHRPLPFVTPSNARPGIGPLYFPNRHRSLISYRSSAIMIGESSSVQILDETIEAFFFSLFPSRYNYYVYTYICISLFESNLWYPRIYHVYCLVHVFFDSWFIWLIGMNIWLNPDLHVNESDFCPNPI